MSYLRSEAIAFCSRSGKACNGDRTLKQLSHCYFPILSMIAALRQIEHSAIALLESGQTPLILPMLLKSRHCLQKHHIPTLIRFNVPLQRRLVTFASPPISFNRPLQGGCYVLYLSLERDVLNCIHPFIGF